MSLKNNHLTRISVVPVAVEVPSSWAAEASVAVAAALAEEVSEAVASEAVVQEAVFRLRPVSS